MDLGRVAVSITLDAQQASSIPTRHVIVWPSVVEEKRSHELRRQRDSCQVAQSVPVTVLKSDHLVRLGVPWCWKCHRSSVALVSFGDVPCARLTSRTYESSELHAARCQQSVITRKLAAGISPTPCGKTVAHHLYASRKQARKCNTPLRSFMHLHRCDHPDRTNVRPLEIWLASGR